MTRVVLEGILGKKYGREWNLKCNTPQRALQIIDANVGDLFMFMRKNIEPYAGYAVIVDGTEYDTERYLSDKSKTSPKEIRFVPYVAGAGGLFKGIFGRIVMTVAICVAAYFTAGAALSAIGAEIGSSGLAGATALEGAMAAGTVTSQASALAYVNTLGLSAVDAGLLSTTVNIAFANSAMSLAFASTLSSVGTAMALGTLTSALTKTPQANNSDFENSSDATNHYFDGAVNTEKQGVGIPLIYGRILAGSHPISVHLTVK